MITRLHMPRAIVPAVGGLVLAVLLAAAAQAAPRREPAVVGYVETLCGGARVADLDLGPVTHVIDAFVLPDRQGRLRPANGLPRTGLVERCHAEGRLALVSIGGGTVPGAVFSSIASRDRSLERFARGVVEFAMGAGYDGVDIDWEFPESHERALYVKLIRRVREEMVRADWRTADGDPALLLFGVSTGYWIGGYDFAALDALTDFAVYFGYDFRNPALGPWMHYDMITPKDEARPVEASVSGMVAEIARRGYAPGKILVGLPFYTSHGRPWTTARTTPGLDETELHPLYLEKLVAGEWINDADAVRAKVAAALGRNVAAGRAAGGVAIWQLGHQGAHDDLTGAVADALAARQRPVRTGEAPRPRASSAAAETAGRETTP